MDAISNLTVVFKAETGKFSSEMKGLGSAFSDVVKSTKNLASEGTVNAGQLQKGMIGVGDVMWKVAGAATLAGVGIATAIGVKSVKAAGDFQQSMTLLTTSAGESSKNIKAVSDGILNLAVATGTSTEQLASGMFMVESSGYHGAGGLDVLKSAAQGARAEGANLETVTNALTTEMTDYHMSTNQSTSAMNGLIAASASGKMHLEDLAGSMGAVLPLASSLHISFPQVAGAIATMTNAGMSAQNASQNLANAINALSAPNSVAVKAMQETGLTAQQLKDTMSSQGLTGAISLIEQHVGKTFPSGSVQAVTAFKDLMGGATGYNVALMLGGKNMDAYKNNVSNISKAMQSGKGDVEGWSEVQSNWNFKVSQAHEVMQTLFIRIGQQLLPAVGKLMDQVLPLIVGFADWVVKSGALQNTLGFLGGAITNVVSVGQGIISFFQQNQVAMDLLMGVGIALAGAIAATMVVAFVAWAVAAGGAAIATLAATWPILAIGAVIALVVAGIILAIQHWGEIAHWLQGVWSAVAGAVVSAWNATGAFFVGLWQDIANIFGNIGQWFTDRWNEAAQGVKSGVDAIKNFFGGIGNWFHDQWTGAVDATKNAWQGISDGAKSGWQNTGNAIKSGWDGAKNLFHEGTQAVVNASQWMYDHNYYFKALSDAEHAAFDAAKNTAITIWSDVTSWLSNTWSTITLTAQNIWSGLTSWLSNTWSTIARTAKSIWTTVSTAISTAVSSVVTWLTDRWNQVTGWIGEKWRYLSTLATVYYTALRIAIQVEIFRVQQWLMGIWNGITGWLSAKWNSFAGLARSAWSAVSGIFGGIWSNYIAGPLGNLWNQLTGWFNNLVGQAASWGSNLIQGFIDGINNMIGQAGAAAQNIASTIAGYLGFHSPSKEGPGRELSVWGPNMVKGFSQGITSSIPVLQNAIARLSAVLTPSIGGVPLAGGSSASMPTSSLPYPIVPTAPLQGNSGGGTQRSGETHIHIYMDGQEITNKVMTRAVRQIRAQGGKVMSL